jgi:hypothetical protein
MNIFGNSDVVRKVRAARHVLYRLSARLQFQTSHVASPVQLESQLKQKTVQMDNLDNVLSVTKKELAEQRREKELAEQVHQMRTTWFRCRSCEHRTTPKLFEMQELSAQASRMNGLEEQNIKLNKVRETSSQLLVL